MTEDALAAKLPGQRADDVRAGLARLRADGLVRADAIAVTTRGRDVRQRIEDETDRRFFDPWPEDVGREGAWIAERLAAVNTALAPAS